ncbi:MAG: 4-hydroxybenzoate octaprenyltransferase, partial [Rhodospirillaceae bacterium]
FVIAMYALTILLLAVAVGLTGFSWISSGLLFLVACHFTWQAATLDTEDSANCLARFKSNRDAGFFIALAMWAASF